MGWNVLGWAGIYSARLTLADLGFPGLSWLGLAGFNPAGLSWIRLDVAEIGSARTD